MNRRGLIALFVVSQCLNDVAFLFGLLLSNFRFENKPTPVYNTP